jgi:hypothetical protein
MSVDWSVILANLKADIFKALHRSLDARFDLIALDMQQRSADDLFLQGDQPALDRVERNARASEPSDSLGEP